MLNENVCELKVESRDRASNEAYGYIFQRLCEIVAKTINAPYADAPDVKDIVMSAFESFWGLEINNQNRNKILFWYLLRVVKNKISDTYRKVVREKRILQQWSELSWAGGEWHTETEELYGLLDQFSSELNQSVEVHLRESTERSAKLSKREANRYYKRLSRARLDIAIRVMEVVHSVEANWKIKRVERGAKK